MDILEKHFSLLKNYEKPGIYALSPRAFSMNYIWSFKDYLIFILANKGKTLTMEIENFVEEYFNDDESKLITKEAVSKQRQKFSYEIFIDMNRYFIKDFMNSIEYKYFFKDKIVLVIDGSKSEIPNAPESKEWANIKDDSPSNKKALRALFSTVTDIKYGIILDSILGKYNSSERDLFKQHINNIKDLVDLKKVIIIVDAGYYSLELKLILEKKGINYIFRLPPNTYNDEISKMKNFDENLRFSNTTARRQNIKEENILKKAKKLPYIEGRVVKVPIINEKDEEDELILLTNLLQDKFNGYEIAGLYRERWEIEVNYDRLKNKMEIENYSGKLEQTIKQDFHSSIYIFNLAMILRNNIQKHLERKNKKKREKENKEYRTIVFYHEFMSKNLFNQFSV